MYEDSYLDTWMEDRLSGGHDTYDRYDPYEDDYLALRAPYSDDFYDEDDDDLRGYEPSPRGRGDLGEL